MRRNNALQVFTLVCVLISLLMALTPLSDIDNDGFWDSIVTEGLLLSSAFLVLTGLPFLVTKFPVACFDAPQPLLTLFVPPPIFN